MVYLLYGADLAARDRKISELKKRLIPSAEADTFDCESLYAAEVGPDEIKKALITQPVIAKRRLVIIRGCQKLTDGQMGLLTELCAGGGDAFHCILDFDSDLKDNAFIKKISRLAETFNYKGAQPKKIFDVTDAIASGRKEQALKALSEILSGGDHPLKVLGGLIWFWGNHKNRLRKDSFHEGLKAIQHADLNIKRSRLDPEFAVEMLVVKLCLLTSG